MYFVRVGLQVILIWAKASIVIVMAIPAVMVIFRMMILSIYCRNNYPGLDKKVVRDNSALSKRWSAMAHQLAGRKEKLLRNRFIKVYNGGVCGRYSHSAAL